MASPKKEAPSQVERVTIQPPNLKRIALELTGNAPYVQHAFSAKAQQTILAKHLDPTLRSKKVRIAKVPKDLYEAAKHRTADGRLGIPASAFRAAAISACRLIGFKMTLAKLSVFIEADGYDAADGTALVFIKGKPEMVQHRTRNESGVPDIRFRPMWREWSATIRVVYDADQFTATDVVNLMARVGLQVGVGEGRPDSKESVGMGWGTFTVKAQGAREEAAA